MSQQRDAIDNMLSLRRACPEAVAWSRKFRTLEELWEALDAPDWALWGLEKFGYRGDRELRQFAVVCAERCKGLWTDPNGARAIEVASRVARGAASRDDLLAAHLAAKRAAEALPDRPDYTEAMAAAAAAAIGAARDLPYDAARDASRESARAIAWDVTRPGSYPEEGAWQCAELRRIIGGAIHPVIADARRSTRGVLHVL